MTHNNHLLVHLQAASHDKHIKKQKDQCMAGATAGSGQICISAKAENKDKATGKEKDGNKA